MDQLRAALPAARLARYEHACANTTTINGEPITDDTITGLVADAEAGFPDATLNPVGRPRTVGTKRAEPSPPPSTRYAVAPSMSTWPADG